MRRFLEYRAGIREEDKLMDLLRRAHETHEAATGAAARGSDADPVVTTVTGQDR